MAKPFDRPNLHLALARFGLGARRNSAELLRGDPREILLNDIAAGIVIPQENELPSSESALFELNVSSAEMKLRRKTNSTSSSEMSPNSATVPPFDQKIYQIETESRLKLTLASEVGFCERWVRFFTNHFAISAAKGNRLRVISGAYEREAIRPHALGHFSDMLIATTTHPAMLLFLDNTDSVGPQSLAGQKRGRGLNENLGRELLELHTLGVDGGYTQHDVTALARILTGWTVAGSDGRLGRPGTAVLNVNAHEPGPISLLNRTYVGDGNSQIISALRDLSNNPATAIHIARKIVQHFVGRAAPESLTDRLAVTFRQTEGDLSSVARTLIMSSEAWTPSGRLRTPQDWLIAAARALEINFGTKSYLQRLRLLGEPLWAPLSPLGHPDTDEAWLAPEGLRTRLNLSVRIAANSADLEPRALLESILGSAVSPETTDTLLRAESRSQAAALLLMAPEFQRR